MNTLKIGIPAVLTGKYSIQGIESFKGIKLWLKKVKNQKGIKLNNSKFINPELIFYDTKSNSDITKQIAEDLITKDKADILLGPYSSTLSLIFLKASAKHKRVVWNYGGSSNDIHNFGYNKIISTITEASCYFEGVIKLITEIEKVSKIAVLKLEDSNFASNVANGAKIFAENLGLSVEIFEFNSNSNEFPEIINKVKKQNIEFLFCVGKAEDDIKLCKYLVKQQENKIKISTTLASAINEFKNELREDCDYFVSTSQWEPSLNFSVDYGPKVEEFVQDFKNEFGYLPDYPAAQAYNIGVVLEYLISRTENINENELLNKAKNLSFKTFYGDFKVDKSGRQIGHETLVTQWQNGQKYIIFPTKYANSNLLLQS